MYFTKLHFTLWSRKGIYSSYEN